MLFNKIHNKEVADPMTEDFTSGENLTRTSAGILKTFS